MNDRKLTIERLYKPEFIDSSSIIGIASPWQLNCLTYGGLRIYWHWPEGATEPTFYQGSSTFVKRVVPSGLLGEEYLRDWAIDTFENTDQYKHFLNVAAAYGSFIHWQIRKLVSDGKVSYSELKEDLAEYLQKEGLVVPNFLYLWFEKAKSDLISFWAFVKAYNVRILACEFPIAGNFGAATRIDLICLLDLPVKENGQPYTVWPVDTSKVKNWIRNVLAIGDIKSKLYSRNPGSFSPGNAFQLYTYRRLWNDSYAGIGLPIDFIFNWSPAAKSERFHFRAWTSIRQFGDTAELSFEDKTCHPEMMDDLIRFNMRWPASAVNNFTRIKFDELSLSGGPEQFTYDQLIDIAKRARTEDFDAQQFAADYDDDGVEL